MSSIKCNANIDISDLHLTEISFKIDINGFIYIFDEKTDDVNTLLIEEKGWRRVISGVLFDNNTIKIEAVGKEQIHRTVFGTILEPEERTSERIIRINGENFGTLRECSSLKFSWLIEPQPYHHTLNNWETFYYGNTTRDVQIYYKSNLFAVAKYYKGFYQFLILKNNYLSFCLGLALAAIDSSDNGDI